MKLIDVAEPVEPTLGTTSGSALYQRFEREPDVLAIAVIDPAGRPVGIVERNSFFLSMAGEWGRPLYGQRPVSMLMNAEPMIVDADVTLSAFTGQALAERPSELLHGFIVVRNGLYAGIGSALGLLQATNRANRAHALEMTSLAETLQDAQTQAKAALEAKSQFLAVMSHEIRTPLNGVLSVAEILARRMRQEELKPFVRIILDSGETLLRLLSDALDISRMEAGQLDMKHEPFVVRTVIDDVAALWTAKAAERRLAWDAVYSGPPGLEVLGDAMRLKQVFDNLVGNALKFTERGHVRVRLEAQSEGARVRLKATVSDSGPGVPRDKLESIFQPFVQDEAGRTVGGAGLGLSICRQLAEQMGGSIRAACAQGRGLEVIFEAVLPAADAAGDHTALGPVEEGCLPRLHVLVADDNATNRRVAEALCGIFECTSSSVENGLEAVQAALTGAFDLVLMDIKMPYLDGMEAIARIRASGGPSADLPIVVLTANADPRDAEAYLAGGADAVVEKPIKPDLLMQAMRQALARRAPRTDANARVA